MMFFFNWWFVGEIILFLINHMIWTMILSTILVLHTIRVYFQGVLYQCTINQ